MPFGFVAAAFEAAAVELGIGAATAGIVGDIGAGVVGGAVLGAGESAVTGGDILRGAEIGAVTGAVTGGGIGLGGNLLGDTIGTTAADVVGGAAGGATGAAVTGGNPALGAVEGGFAGGLSAAGGLSGVSDALGITGPAGSADFALPGVDTSTGQSIPTGGPVSLNASHAFGTSGGVTPSVNTSVAPSSGGGFTSAGSLLTGGSQPIDALLNSGNSADAAIGGYSTAGSPDLGSLATGGQTSIPAGGLPSTAPSAEITAAANDSGSSGGFFSGAKDFLPSKGDFGKAALSSALPLGALAYQAIQGPSPLPSAAAPLKESGAVTAPLVNTETQSLNAYNSGTLTQPQQANIMKYIQDSQNQLIQQLASQGVTDIHNDSRYISGLEQIRANAMGYQQQYLEQSLRAGLGAAGAASTNLAGVASQQVAQDKEFQDSLAAAFSALGGAAGARAAA